MTNEAPIEIGNTKNPTGSVIWLHGLGADGHDFTPIVESLRIAHLRFILPHAPYRKVTINNGYEMRAWYDIYGLTIGSPEDEQGIRESQANIESLIDNEIARGIPSEKIIIAGFSQGGAIALHTAMRYQKPLAGIVALSTYLPLKSTLPLEKSAQNQTCPIMMAHGTEDDVISLDTSRASLACLQAEQYQVEWHEYPISHSVSIDEVSDIGHFLLSVTT